MIYWNPEDETTQEIEVQDVFHEIDINIFKSTFSVFEAYFGISTEDDICFLTKKELGEFIKSLTEIYDKLEDNPKGVFEYKDTCYHLGYCHE